MLLLLLLLITLLVQRALTRFGTMWTLSAC
jgi:hypothetical protein